MQRQPGADPDAIALAFGRLSRSIRLTFALENRIAEGRLAVETHVTTKAARAVDHAFEGALFNHRWRVEDLVGDQMKAASGDDDDRYEALEREAHERLTDVEDDDTILGQSAAEIVAEICAALGVVVDPELFEAEDLVRPSAHLGAGGDPGKTLQHPPDEPEPYDPDPGSGRDERDEGAVSAISGLESGP